MRLEVRRLRELFTASVERTYVRPIASVDSHVSAKIEVETKPLATSFERTLKRFLARVHQLVPFELGTLDESFAAFRAYMYPRPVRMQVLAHRTVVPEHLRASLVRARNCSFDTVHHRGFAYLQLVTGPREFSELFRVGEIQTRHTVRHRTVRIELGIGFARHVFRVVGIRFWIRTLIWNIHIQVRR